MGFTPGITSNRAPKLTKNNFSCVPTFSADFPQLPKKFLDAIKSKRYNPY
jgi:hypothetical protein